MSPSEPTWPSWQCSLLMNFEPSPKGFRQVLSQIISGGEGDGGGGEGEGGGDGGQERNVTVPTHTLLASAMAWAQASPESPCRLRPEWNSACVLRGGVLIVWPGRVVVYTPPVARVGYTATRSLLPLWAQAER